MLNLAILALILIVSSCHNPPRFEQNDGGSQTKRLRYGKVLEIKLSDKYRPRTFAQPKERNFLSRNEPKEVNLSNDGQDRLHSFGRPGILRQGEPTSHYDRRSEEKSRIAMDYLRQINPHKDKQNKFQMSGYSREELPGHYGPSRYDRQHSIDHTRYDRANPFSQSSSHDSKIFQQAVKEEQRLFGKSKSEHNRMLQLSRDQTKHMNGGHSNVESLLTRSHSKDDTPHLHGRLKQETKNFNKRGNEVHRIGDTLIQRHKVLKASKKEMQYVPWQSEMEPRQFRDSSWDHASGMPGGDPGMSADDQPSQMGYEGGEPQLESSPEIS
ncbi:hypothetical protein ACOME3_003364 [Neoechinorhynchus agilis]